MLAETHQSSHSACAVLKNITITKNTVDYWKTHNEYDISNLHVSNTETAHHPACDLMISWGPLWTVDHALMRTSTAASI